MSKDRIQIDGVWYVREEPEFDISDQIFHVRQCGYEDQEILLECSYSIKDDPEPHDTPSVIFLDKAEHGLDWNKQEFWDNTSWMKGVAEGNPVSTPEVPSKYLPRVRAFFNYLIKQNILK